VDQQDSQKKNRLGPTRRKKDHKKRRPTRFPGKEETGTHKKKEGRFNPSGQVSMRQRRTDRFLSRALMSIYIL